MAEREAGGRGRRHCTAAALGGGVVAVVAEGKECNYTRSFWPFFTEKQFKPRLQRQRANGSGLRRQRRGEKTMTMILILIVSLTR